MPEESGQAEARIDEQPQAVLGCDLPRAVRDIGKSAVYTGGWLQERSERSYRAMSHEIVAFGSEHGINLLRKGVKTVSHLLIPMPAGSYYAEHRMAYKHNKILPSVAIHDDHILHDTLRYYHQTCCPEHDLVTIVIAALDERVSVDNLEGGISLAFRNYNQLRRSVEKQNPDVEFLTARLEMPFNPKTTDFYLHFHIIARVPARQGSRWRLEDTIRDKLKFGSPEGLEVKWIEDSKISRAVRYSIKPCITAWQIAMSGNESVFNDFVEIVKGRPMFRSHGTLSRLKTDIKNGKQRLVRERPEDRESPLRLVETSDWTSVGKIDLENKNINSAGRLTEVQGVESDNAERLNGKLPRVNIFSGVSQPRALPGNHLAAFAVVGNFDPSCRGFLKSSLYDRYNAFARHAYEMNTGHPYDVVEFLRPKARIMLAALNADDTSVLHYTVSCSNDIRILLEKIVEEEHPPPFRHSPSGVELSKTIHEIHQDQKADGLKPIDDLSAVLEVRELDDVPF